MIDLKPYAQTLNGKPVAVYGLGVSGLSAVRALCAAGVKVHAWDDKPEQRTQAEKSGAVIDSMEDVSGFALLALSPGIPLYYPVPHPVVESARKAGIEIIGDIELFHRSSHGCKTIGVTGTNGKSTTTALIHHVLNACRIPALMGGNIGNAVLDLNISGDTKPVVVLELSSYQLDLCADFTADIAIHLNIAPDHIDRHESMEGYVKAKQRIFDGSGKAIIGIDDKHSTQMMEDVRKTGIRDVYAISTAKAVARGAYVEKGVLFEASGKQPTEIGSVSGFKSLPGVHSQQNILAAYMACRQAGCVAEDILKAFATYPGLPHRLHTVRVINGVAYINDSKATNADAAGKALMSYPHIYWILGGLPKEGGLNGLEKMMDRIRHAFVIGEAAADFAQWLEDRGVSVTQCGVLEQAVKQAHIMAQRDRGEPGGAGVVLLSPACASFDQFRSFEHRGDSFSDLVESLKEDGKEAAA